MHSLSNKVLIILLTSLTFSFLYLLFEFNTLPNSQGDAIGGGYLLIVALASVLEFWLIQMCLASGIIVKIFTAKLSIFVVAFILAIFAAVIFCSSFVFQRYGSYEGILQHWPFFLSIPLGLLEYLYVKIDF